MLDHDLDRPDDAWLRKDTSGDRKAAGCRGDSERLIDVPERSVRVLPEDVRGGGTWKCLTAN